MPFFFSFSGLWCLMKSLYIILNNYIYIKHFTTIYSICMMWGSRERKLTQELSSKSWNLTHYCEFLDHNFSLDHPHVEWTSLSQTLLWRAEDIFICFIPSILWGHLHSYVNWLMILFCEILMTETLFLLYVNICSCVYKQYISALRWWISAQ